MTSSPHLPLIHIIGSLNTDLTTYTPRIPLGGETLHATAFQTSSGGKGGNQAVACAKLSRSRTLTNATATIRMIGAVGSDAHGHALLADLQSAGVETSGVLVRKDVETGVAVILVEEGSGENRILLTAGANASLMPGQFEDSLGEEKGGRVPGLVILQLEIPVETTVTILRTAKGRGVDVLLNPAPAVEIPVEAYVGLKYLVLNETEAVILSGCDAEALEREESLPGVADVFHGRGVANVIITLGGRGVYFSGEGGENGLVRAKKVEVVDTTAAGDTFVGAYALEAVKGGVGIESAVRRANEAAAKTIGKRGAQKSIPWADELS
ncbi:ribokinase [Cadophora sp. MPI-SDFR-AT-0126]|nr:ribokinase [Leotiomycetes sp. MPI-SDFR-AT-0126]